MSGDNYNTALTEGVFYILISLYTPMHGYGIMQNVLELSNGRVNLAPGTLYGAINTLLERGFIKALTPEANSRKKEYIITPEGKKAVELELQRLRELLRYGEEVVGRDKNAT